MKSIIFLLSLIIYSTEGKLRIELQFSPNAVIIVLLGFYY